MEMFIQLTKSDMAALAPTALKSLRWVLENDEEDERGKPIVPAASKNQAAMFLLEHVVGKPKQQVQTELSVKLQGILGVAMANPADALAAPEQGGQGYRLGHLPGVTVPMLEARDGEEDEDFDDVANG